MDGGVSITKTSLKFSGVNLFDLAKKYDTPLYVFSENRILHNYKRLHKAFADHYAKTQIYYSFKTNFELQIVSSLKKAGASADTSSALEVELALKAGFAPNEIIIDGPVWSDDEITYCLKTGIHMFNVDSIDMMTRVNNLAKKHKKNAQVGYRIYSEIKKPPLSGFVESYLSKFGIPLSQAVDAFSYAKSLSNVTPHAISTHIGSMITDISSYEKELDALFHLAAKLRDTLDIRITEINTGGGYGVQSLKYYSMQSAILEKAGIEKLHNAPSLEEFGKRIAGRFSRNTKKYKLEDMTFALEPGRAIISDAGILLSKVVSVKKNKKANWIFVDGGANLVPESIFFIRRDFLVVNKPIRELTEKYSIAGPTLNTIDVLATNQPLPPMEIGDIIAILDAGAYTLSRSNQFTRLRPSALYITQNKKVKYLRKKEKPEEFFNKMLP
jgi:diaminopimelate decarboxylase